MKKLIFLTAITVLFIGTASALTYQQAQVNALICVELVKFSAELTSPTMNDFMLKSKKVVFDKNGSVYIIEKSFGDIKFKYLDKNKKPITGKNLSEAFNNAYKNAVSVEIEIRNKLLYSGKLTVTYANPAKKHENLFIEGTLMIKSGKDEVTYKIAEKLTVKALTPATTVLSGGVLKSDGAFKDMIIIDFSKNVMSSGVDAAATPVAKFNSEKRSKKIENLKLLLSK